MGIVHDKSVADSEERVRLCMVGAHWLLLDRIPRKVLELSDFGFPGEDATPGQLHQTGEVLSGGPGRGEGAREVEIAAVKQSRSLYRGTVGQHEKKQKTVLVVL